MVIATNTHRNTGAGDVRPACSFAPCASQTESSFPREVGQELRRRLRRRGTG